MTRNFVIDIPFRQGRLGLPADSLGNGTAGAKAASRGDVHGAGYFAGQQNAFFVAIGIRGRYSRQEGLGVRMQRIGIKFMARGDFDDFAQVHDAMRSLICLTTARSWAMNR